MAFQLHEKSAIDDDVYESVENLHARVLANVGAIQWWDSVGMSLFESSFTTGVNNKIRAIEDLGGTTTEAFAFYRPENWAD